MIEGVDRTVMLNNNVNYAFQPNEYARIDYGEAGEINLLPNARAQEFINDGYNLIERTQIHNPGDDALRDVDIYARERAVGGQVHLQNAAGNPAPNGRPWVNVQNPLRDEIISAAKRGNIVPQNVQIDVVHRDPDDPNHYELHTPNASYSVNYTREFAAFTGNVLQASQPEAPYHAQPPYNPVDILPQVAPVGAEVPAREVNRETPAPDWGRLLGGFGGSDNPPANPPAYYGPAQTQEVPNAPIPNRPQIRPLHVRNLTNEIRPVHVRPLKQEISPAHVKGQLKTLPLKRSDKKLPPLKAATKTPDQTPKEVVKVTTPPKRISQTNRKEVKSEAPQPTVNINVAEKKSENPPMAPEAKGARTEQKGGFNDLEKLIKILQLLQPKLVSKSTPQMPQLVRMLSESPKGVSTPEKTTYIQIPDIDKITKMIDEIQLYIKSQEKKTEREGDTYTLIPMPDGRIVDRNEETIKVLREIKETLGQEQSKGETNTYIQIPEQSPTYIQLPGEKNKEEHVSYIQLPEDKSKEEHVSYIQLPEEKNKEEHVSYIQLPEEKNKEEHVSYIQLPEGKSKEEHVTYIQLPEGKGVAAVTENEETYLKLPRHEIIEEYAKKTENKDMTEKRGEERRIEPAINTPQLPIMGMAPIPMPMPPAQPQQPIIINQGMSEGETKSSFWSNFFKVLLILLLLASLIGIGYLMYKNAHTQQQDEKPKPEPKPDSKPDPKPEPEVTKEVKVEGNPEPSKPVPTNEGETLKPVCPDGQNIQLNVDADKVNLGADTGNITQTAKDAINLEQVGTHNKLVSNSGTIDTSRIIIDNDRIQVREWGDITQNPRVYEGTIQSNGKALINGIEYTITDVNGKAYSQGAIDIANQTTYSRNNDQTLSTDFGTLKPDLQINKNDTFTLSTKTENGTVIANNNVDDISNNTTIQNMLKDKLNDTSITEGEKNRVMDALDDGKLNNSYLKTVSNSSSLSLNNSNSVENSAGV